jgi:hypothetical protein
MLLSSMALLQGQIPTDTRKDALIAAGIDGTCQIDSINIKRYDIITRLRG